MKKITSALLATTCFLMLLGNSAAVVEEVIKDPIGDVKNLETNETVDIPCIDIKKVTFYQDGKDVTLTLQVAGKIGREGIQEKYYMYSILIVIETKVGDERKEYDVSYLDMDMGEFAGQKMKYKEGAVLYKGKNISQDVGVYTADTLRASFQLRDGKEKCLSINATTVLMAMNSPLTENISKAGTDRLFYQFPKGTNTNVSANNTQQNNKEKKSKSKTPDVGTAGLLAAIAAAIVFSVLRKNKG